MQINLPIVCPAALAIVAWVRWVNWSVHTEFVAAAQGNPLQPALSGHLGDRGNTIGNVGEFQVGRRSQVPWELEVLGNHVASAKGALRPNKGHRKKGKETTSTTQTTQALS